MKRFVGFGVFALLGLGLGSCSSGGDSSPDYGYIVDFHHVVVEMDDGTNVDCIALLGVKRGGLSCNWDDVN